MWVAQKLAPGDIVERKSKAETLLDMAIVEKRNLCILQLPVSQEKVVAIGRWFLREVDEVVSLERLSY